MRINSNILYNTQYNIQQNEQVTTYIYIYIYIYIYNTVQYSTVQHKYHHMDIFIDTLQIFGSSEMHEHLLRYQSADQ